MFLYQKDSNPVSQGHRVNLILFNILKFILSSSKIKPFPDPERNSLKSEIRRNQNQFITKISGHTKIHNDFSSELNH
jgi:hypothetical protein